MTPEFKQELQKLIDDAAWKNRHTTSESELTPTNCFKAGCNFLMPLIEELMKQRDSWIHGYGPSVDVDDNIAQENEGLINLLRGEK